MKRALSTICASTLALSMALSAVPASAAPMFVPKAAEATTDVQKVQDSRWRGRGDHDWRDRGDWGGKRIIRRGDHHYFNGHRGSKYHRSGWRRHGDFWFPAAAFLGAAIITGSIIANDRRRVVRRVDDAHVEWCYDRWLSYREWDNTYKPSKGPRRECNSPFD